MRPRARFLALRLAAGLLPLGPATAIAGPSGEGAPAPGPGVDEAAPDGGSENEGDGAEKPEKPEKPEEGKGAKKALRASTKDDATLSKRTDRKWIRRWAPERGMIELGAFGGMMVLARDLELFEPRTNRPNQGFLPLARIAPDLGVRVGYFPLRYLGVEAEAALVPTETRDDGFPAYVFTGRGHLVGQLPFASVTPFAVFGAGALGVQSDPEIVLGRDIDPAFHLGLGAKFFINRRLMVRLDLRDVISPRRGITGGATNSLEALLGLSFTLGRERDVDEKEPEPEPEPEPAPSDRDEDGFIDDEDACPDEPGVAPDGCPAPSDRDGDGFIDDEDACPDEAGVAPDGCPDLDADKDGILVPDDTCPDEPETYNGYEDEDGCPDEVPDDLQKFGGRLEGINFDLGKASLTADSKPVLDAAVEVLQKYQHIRIEVSGHTDNSGSRELNMKLSQQRAEAVRDYLVDKGIDASRIDTRGAGPDEPIDSNATKEGRANNRRIEFYVLD